MRRTTPRKNPPCKKAVYWGRGGAGMMFTCSADDTVLLLLRAEWAYEGGTWGVPGGGIEEGDYRTPIKDPVTDLRVYARVAVREVEEECGGLPPGLSASALVSAASAGRLPYTEYEDCGFRYLTFIVDLTPEQKAAWRPYSSDDETDDFVWFPRSEVRRGATLDGHRLHFGVEFTMDRLRASARTNPEIDIRPLAQMGADQIQQAVLDYRPVEGHAHSARLRKAKAILARRGYAVKGSPLGAGTMGTVFELEEYPNYVAKLTYAPTDAAIMAEIAQIERRANKAGRKMPAGLPRVITVAALGTERDPTGLYLVVIERLVPLTPEQRKRVAKMANETCWGQTADIEDELWSVWQKRPGTPEHAFLSAARKIHEMGYIPYDLDAPNLMRRPSDDSVVVSDFGYSAPKKGVRGREVACLRNPGRRAR
jgi:8-oxo-dGTP pyrophosphatase MutT (NUDIX family)